VLHDGNLHSNKRQRSLLAARQVAHLILIQSHCLRAVRRIAVLRHGAIEFHDGIVARRDDRRSGGTPFDSSTRSREREGPKTIRIPSPARFECNAIPHR
jgi:hypothetical protein